MNHYLDKLLTAKGVRTKYVLFVHLSDLIEKVIKSKNPKTYRYGIKCKMYLINDEIYVTYVDCVRKIIGNSHFKRCKVICNKVDNELERIHTINNIKNDDYHISKSWAIDMVELESLVENLCYGKIMINQKEVIVINPEVEKFYDLGMATDINNYNLKRSIQAQV